MIRISDPDSDDPAAGRPPEHHSDAAALPEQHPFDAFPPDWTLIDTHENDSICSGDFTHGPADAFVGKIFAEAEGTDIVLAGIENLDQDGNGVRHSGEDLHIFYWTASDGIADNRDVVMNFFFGRDRLRFEDLLDDSHDLPALLHDGGITVTEQDDGSLLLAHGSQQVEIHHQGSISDDLIHALTGDDTAAAAQVLRQMLLTTG